jgi:hypothetical protein
MFTNFKTLGSNLMPVHEQTLGKHALPNYVAQIWNAQ